MPDLCYKALTRRAQALRGQKDFKEAIEDLEESKKLFPEETDPDKLIALYKEDMEHDARVHKIMANADSLKGKEYIDFLVDFLMGKMGDGSEN